MTGIDRGIGAGTRRIPGASVRAAGLVVVLVACLFGCSASAWAAVDTVTSLSGSATAAGSLGYEIANASGGDTIAFQSGLTGTITLSSAITISQDLTITGPGAGQLTISGGGQSQIFDVTTQSFSISGLTLTDAGGGAVVFNPSSVPSSLTVSAMTFSQDTAPGGNGGAITEESGVDTFTVTGSTFTDDAAGDGGAIWDQGSIPMSVSGSTFSGDSASSNGGAIYSDEGSELDVSDTSFTGDSASSQGGAIYNLSDPTSVSGSTFSGDSAGSSGSGQGGAVDGDQVSVSGSTLSGDSAGSSGSGQGGALFVESGPSTVSDSTLTRNSAGGTGGEGGAIDVGTPGLTLTSDTIDQNAASGGGSGIYGARGVTALATIVADNTGAPDCDVPVRSSSFSLEGQAGNTSCGFDLPSAEPDLGALADNGGPTQTQALPAASPAVDVIPAADCPSADNGVDQRGDLRPSPGSGYCDVGAFELQDTTQTTLSCPSAAVALGAGSPGCAAAVTATDAPTAGTPAGQVAYRVYSDAACSVTATGSQTVALGSGGSVPMFSPTAVPAGAWYVQATFAPAASAASFVLQGSSSPCAALSVAKAPVTLSSAVLDVASGTPWSASGEPSGSSATDTATLGSTLAAFPAGGTVSYALYDDATCTGTPASTQTVNVSAGTVPDSAATAALTAGPYGYLATYSGDPDYTAPGAPTCEPFTVNAEVPNRADIRVGISGPGSAADGATFAETITVSDAGPATATDVVTALLVPAGVTVTNADGASTLGPLLDWTAGTIAANATKTYLVSFRVDAHTNALAVIAVAAASLRTPDPNYANNAATTTVTLGTVPGYSARVRHTRDPLALGRRLVARLRAVEQNNHNRSTSPPTRAARPAHLQTPSAHGAPDAAPYATRFL